jgi:hypothetical protein
LVLRHRLVLPRPYIAQAIADIEALACGGRSFGERDLLRVRGVLGRIKFFHPERARHLDDALKQATKGRRPLACCQGPQAWTPGTRVYP